jgi:hypothetical protein
MVVKTKCSVHKGAFGIIFLKSSNGTWEAKKVFKLSESRAQKGYGSNTIKGPLFISADYPGCPYCGNGSFFLCNGCRTLNCQGSATSKEAGRVYVDCANCGPVGYLEGNIEQLDGFADL